MNQYEMMGKLVLVSKQYQRTCSGRHRTWQAVDIRATRGWIVGFRTIYDGYMDCDTGEYGEIESWYYFVHGQHINCILVSFAPRQNPVRVPLDGFELVTA